LRAIFHIEIRADDDFVAVTLECGVKRRITIVRRIKNQVENDQARTRCKQSIQQKRPDFARPREWPLGHELKRPVTRQFFRGKRR